MDGKLTLSALSALLAGKTGITRRETDAFLKELFGEISANLERGENVKVKGLGTFKVGDVSSRKSVSVANGEDIRIPSHVKVTFTPDKELAAAVNAPFSMFESVELSDDVTDEVLMNAEREEIPFPDIENTEKQPGTGEERPEEREDTYEAEENVETSSAEEEKLIPAKEILETNVKESVDDIPEVKESAEEKPSVEESETIGPEGLVEEDEKIVDYPRDEIPRIRHRIPSFIWFLIGFASACAIFAIVVVAFRFTNDVAHEIPKSSVPVALKKTDTVVADTLKVTPADSSAVEMKEAEAAAEPETAPSDKKITDTITRTRYLTTMSREYYGNYHFWCYIYEENKDILGHPDRIRPGTKVTIPSLSKYGVDPKNPNDLRDAKRKGAAIYARFNK